jgi:hypothetical protein
MSSKIDEEALSWKEESSVDNSEALSLTDITQDYDQSTLNGVPIIMEHKNHSNPAYMLKKNTAPRNMAASDSFRTDITSFGTDVTRRHTLNIPNPTSMDRSTPPLRPSLNRRLSNHGNYMDDNSIDKYPNDSYSFLALHGPFETSEKRTFFLFGLVPFLFQILFLLLSLWSVLDQKRGTVGDTDNADAENDGFVLFAKFTASNANPIVKVTQFVSIAAYVIFPSTSVMDIVAALQMFPRLSDVSVEDPVKCMLFSCLCRGVQGLLAVLTTAILVVTSDTVIDIILNFTAMNFISELDEVAFSFAMSGEFGPVLRQEAERLSKTELPPCIYKKSKHVYYRVVAGLVSLILFGMLVFVIASQNSNNKWVTKTLRVQFQERTGIGRYSGCYQISDDSSANNYGRRNYNSFDKGIHNTSFGYCRETRQWLLFKGNGNGFDPCDASKKNLELAHSAKTDTFEISTSFDESWVSASNTPLDMYFFDGETETNILEHCNAFLGDGKCDPYLNQLGYDFDGGDCCAATCSQSDCGRKTLEGVFGSPKVAEINFPDCKDTTMIPIVIHLSGIESSRGKARVPFYAEDEPESPYFSLECDKKPVLTFYIENSMINRSETVMVNDGASCTLLVRNFTSFLNPSSLNNPIWFVNYTIFHKSNKNDLEVEIVSQQSSEQDTVTFRVIPECYFTKLGDYTNTFSIYKNVGAQNEAIDWLVEADTDEISWCETEDKFIERYALTRIFYTMGIEEKIVSKANQCAWPSILCSQGHVKEINIQRRGGRGAIPSEIEILKNLTEIRFGE